MALISSAIITHGFKIPDSPELQIPDSLTVTFYSFVAFIVYNMVC